MPRKWFIPGKSGAPRPARNGFKRVSLELHNTPSSPFAGSFTNVARWHQAQRCGYAHGFGLTGLSPDQSQANYPRLYINSWTWATQVVPPLGLVFQMPCGNNALLAFPNKLLYQLTDVKPYNLDIPATPAAVTYPESADQVAAIIKCATKSNLKVQARCGGHSYGNYGR